MKIRRDASGGLSLSDTIAHSKTQGVEITFKYLRVELLNVKQLLQIVTNPKPKLYTVPIGNYVLILQLFTYSETGADKYNALIFYERLFHPIPPQ